MANRDMSAQVQAEAGLAKNQPIHLFRADLDSGTAFLTDAYRAVVWNGDTYTAGGHMLGFSAIKETSRAQVSEVSCQLSGVDQTLIAIFLADDYLDRRLRIYKTFLNSDGSAMEPVLIFDGRMDAPVIEENPEPDNGTCTIGISATSHFGDFERKPGRRTNTNVQELHFPGDRFFDYCSEIPAQKQSVWGRAAA